MELLLGTQKTEKLNTDGFMEFQRLQKVPRVPRGCPKAVWRDPKVPKRCPKTHLKEIKSV